MNLHLAQTIELGRPGPDAPDGGWWREPGREVHAFDRRTRSVCGRHVLTPAWTPEPFAEDLRCSVCVDVLTPTQGELRELGGGR